MNNYPQSIEEFLAAPYFERQFVSFFEDGFSENGRGAPANASQAESSPLQFQIAALPGGQPTVIFHVNLHFIFSLLQRYWRTSRVEVPLLLLPRSWAARLHLPLGHPRRKILYAGHPGDPETYIPIADFHRFSFEHKFSGFSAFSGTLARNRSLPDMSEDGVAKSLVRLRPACHTSRLMAQKGFAEAGAAAIKFCSRQSWKAARIGRGFPKASSGITMRPHGK